MFNPCWLILNKTVIHKISFLILIFWIWLEILLIAINAAVCSSEILLISTFTSPECLIWTNYLIPFVPVHQIVHSDVVGLTIKNRRAFYSLWTQPFFELQICTDSWETLGKILVQFHNFLFWDFFMVHYNIIILTIH